MDSFRSLVVLYRERYKDLKKRINFIPSSVRIYTFFCVRWKYKCSSWSFSCVYMCVSPFFIYYLLLLLLIFFFIFAAWAHSFGWEEWARNGIYPIQINAPGNRMNVSSFVCYHDKNDEFFVHLFFSTFRMGGKAVCQHRNPLKHYRTRITNMLFFSGLLFPDAGIKLVNPYAFSPWIRNEKAYSSTIPTCSLLLLLVLFSSSHFVSERVYLKRMQMKVTAKTEHGSCVSIKASLTLAT